MGEILGEFNLISGDEKTEDSYVTVTSKALKFNVATEAALGFPGWVKVYLNRKGNQLAIQGTPKGDDTVEFVTADGRKARFIQIKTPKVMNQINRAMKLEEDGHPISLKAKGMFYPDENVFIYDLDEAVKSIVKPRGRRKAGEAASDEDDIF